MANKDLILDISKRLGLSHIGSNLTALPIIEEIFKIKKLDEKFILSNGHAALALAVVMYGDKAEDIIRENIHADRSWCDCSTGSLGHGLGIAAGMAFSDRTKNVFCLVSDGEMAEGSCWEVLRIATEQNLLNLKIYCNANGFASYQEVDRDYLEYRIKAFGFPVEFRWTENPKGFEGLKGHYAKIT